MKKAALYLLFFNFSVACAQNWCSPGARWQYKSTSGLLGVAATLEYSYSGDTVVNGITCKRISALFLGKHSSLYPNVNYTVVPEFLVHHSYESNRVVHVQHGTSFDTVVNYNAVPGDKWTIRSVSDWCPHSYQWVVQDTGSLVHNGLRLKMITAKCFPDPLYWQGGPQTNIFLERVHHFGFLSDFDLMRGRCYDGTAEFANTSLVCYYDDELGAFSPVNHPCQKLALMQEIGKSEITVFSDPRSKCVRVFVPSNEFSISIFDVLGNKVVASAPLIIGNNSVPTASVCSIFFVCVYKSGDLFKTVKVVL